MMIKSFRDFVEQHSDGSPFYICEGRLVAGFNLAKPITETYPHITYQTIVEIMEEIKMRKEMFETTMSDQFYYEGMKGMTGLICTIKKQYRMEEKK